MSDQAPEQEIRDPRLSKIADYAKLVTSIAVLVTALATGAGGLLMASKNAHRADLGYQALVEKVNALAEKISFIEGRLYGRKPELRAPIKWGMIERHITPTVYALPVALAARPELDASSDLSEADKQKAGDKINSQAYQQLPSSLDTLLQYHERAAQ